MFFDLNFSKYSSLKHHFGPKPGVLIRQESSRMLNINFRQWNQWVAESLNIKSRKSGKSKSGISQLYIQAFATIL